MLTANLRGAVFTLDISTELFRKLSNVHTQPLLLVIFNRSLQEKHLQDDHLGYQILHYVQFKQKTR